VLGSVQDGFQSVVNVVNTTADAITEYQAGVDAFARDLNNLIATPSVLASRLTGLQTSVQNLISSPQQMWDVQKALFDRLKDGSPPDATGTVLAQRQSNESALRTWQQATALSSMIAALSEFNFTTSLDLITAEEGMVSTFNDLLEDDDIRQNISQPLRESLDALNAITQAYLNQQATRTPNTFTVYVEPTPLQELLYRYYGNSDNMADIISLNNITDIAEVSGDLILVTVNDNPA
jgi:prophage DNA circulation protein